MITNSSAKSMPQIVFLVCAVPSVARASSTKPLTSHRATFIFRRTLEFNLYTLLRRCFNNPWRRQKNFFSLNGLAWASNLALEDGCIKWRFHSSPFQPKLARLCIIRTSESGRLPLDIKRRIHILHYIRCSIICTILLLSLKDDGRRIAYRGYGREWSRAR